MNEIGAFLANYYILFIIIAIFAIFALIGYLVESKNGGRQRVAPPPPPQMGETMSSNLETLKSTLANKSLNSMVNDSLQNTTNTNSIPNGNTTQTGFQQVDKL